MSRACIVALMVLAATAAPPAALRAAEPEIEALKAEIAALQKRVEEMERKAAAVVAMPAIEGAAAAVTRRDTIDDRQEAAPRLGDATFDPKFQGFFPIPNTSIIMKFNAKPRVDVTFDSDFAGDDSRFVTAKIPVEGQPMHEGDGETNINGKGSQIRWDVRAPELAGAPRFYYQNDFFGSGGGNFNYRLQHLYGQVYDVVIGHTYSVFEDPDVWPDTVDYEGPNSMVFARKPLVRYQLPLADEWQLNLGLEKPDSSADNYGETPVTTFHRYPDVGFNTRWERSDVGHVQMSGIARGTGVRDVEVDGQTLAEEETVFGWGLNLSAGLDITEKDSLQALGVYGEGIGGLGNDSGFFSTDAAFDADGDLQPLPYYSGMLGFTHRWTDKLRSTVSYGYVEVDNEAMQAGSAYHATQYASANFIYQLYRRLSLGLEGLYGEKETNDGAEGDVWRVQLGLAYSIFD